MQLLPGANDSSPLLPSHFEPTHIPQSVYDESKVDIESGRRVETCSISLVTEAVKTTFPMTSFTCDMDFKTATYRVFFLTGTPLKITSMEKS